MEPAAARATRKPPADGFVSAYPETFFDAILVVSFGGPAGPDDVMPFLENVTRGRGVPRERLTDVACHYQRFGGVSPINQQNRALIAALRTELDAHGIELPIYFGNRNWHPLLDEALGDMAADGVQRALAFFTSAYSSYSSCRQYRENVYDAQLTVGADAPEVLKTRVFFNHPGFIEANVSHVRGALEQIPTDRRHGAQLVFTAHSLPVAMARQSRYEAQLEETARLVAEGVGSSAFELVYQSRSGPPHVPWLEPDIVDHLRALHADGGADVVVSPIGFISDHMEVVFDLDFEAREVADQLGLNMVRAASVGTHPAFVSMIRELIQERLSPGVPRQALGELGPSHDACPVSCCLPGGPGRPSPWERASGRGPAT